MPEIDLSQNIFDVGAEAQLGDWADAALGATLDLRGAAELKRGIDLQLGVGIMGQVEAHFHKFLAADAVVRAEASAELRGQIQAPIDLFEESGVAVRLQASAQAAISARLGIGLAMGDFIALAQQDPRIEGIWLELLTIFLEELKIGAGIRAKAAFSAMAFINVGVTGRLVEDPVTQTPPGFNIGAEWGLGLEGGTAWQLFAHLGFHDTRRMIRRMVDASVDEAVRQIAPHLPDARSRSLAGELRAPAKIALRTAFELGLSVTESAPSNLDNTPELAKRCVLVALEEAQRYLLEQLTNLGVELFKRALLEMGLPSDAWSNAQPQRDALRGKLDGMPREPFEPTAANALYWGELAGASIDLAVQLGGSAGIDEEWVEPIAVTWAATQLLFAGVQRLTSGSVRASFLGAYGVDAQATAFAGALPMDAAPPDLVYDFITDAIGETPGDATLTQDHLVDFLLRETVLEALVEAYPEVEPVLRIAAGPDSEALVAAAQTLMRNAGAFAPPTDSSVPDAEASLRAVAAALQRYLDVRVQLELTPVLHEALADEPELRIYVDEVLLDSVDFVVGTVFDTVLDWGAGSVGHKTAIREACSSILMKLLGRSVVVTADILTAHAMAHVSDELEDLAAEVGAPGGIAEQLADAASQDPEFVEEVMRDTLLIAAEVFGPLPPDRRARVRDALYRLLDPMPAGADGAWVDQLLHDAFIPDPETAASLYQLSDELGQALSDSMMEFLTRVLLKIGEKVAEAVAELVADAAGEIGAWLDELEGLVAELGARLAELPGEILELANEMNERLDTALGAVQELLDLAASDDARAALRDAAVGYFTTLAMAPFTTNPAYQLLPSGVRQDARDAFDGAVRTVVGDGLVDPVLSLLEPAAGEADAALDEIRAVLAELREVDPDADVPAQVHDILMARVEDGVRDWLGGEALTLDIAFDFSYTVVPPRVPTGGYYNAKGKWITTYTQPPSYTATASFDLGGFDMSVSRLIQEATAAVSGLAGLGAVIDEIADALVAAFGLEDAVAAAELELDAATALHGETLDTLADTAAPGIDLVIVEPAPTALYEHDLDIEILLPGVPASFAAAGDLEQPRVLVYLNEEPLDLAGFEVRESDAANGSYAPRSAASGKPTVVSLPPSRTDPTRDGRGREARRTERGRALHRRRGAVTRGSTQPERRKVDARYQWVPDAFEIGRRPGPEERAAVRHAAGEGLRLRRRIPMGDLRLGVNTLTAAVTDGRDRTVERTVVFMAAEPERPKKPVRLPPKPRGGRAGEMLPRHVRVALGLAERDDEAAKPTSRRGPRRDGDPLWLAPRREREKARAERRKEQQDRLRERTTRLSTLRTLTTEKKLRPPLPDRPGDEPGPAEKQNTRRKTGPKTAQKTGGAATEPGADAKDEAGPEGERDA